LDDDHFQAVVVINVHVKHGQDLVMKLVLKVRKLLAQHADMVIVEQGDCAHDRRVGLTSALGDQFGSDEVTECLGSIFVSAPVDQFVEFPED